MKSRAVADAPAKIFSMIVRRLSPPDAAAFRAVRLRALHDHAEAFTSSFEEDSLLPLAYSEQRLGPQSTAQYWGAFDGENLIGTVGLDRDKRVKTRHTALVIGMVVAPECVGRGVVQSAAVPQTQALEAR